MRRIDQGSLKHMLTRKNRYKNRTVRPRPNRVRRMVTGAGLFGLIFYVVGLSLMLILVHDVVTQTGYFKAKSISVDGNRRLTAGQVLEQARINPGENILAVNLGAARKRLLAHPFIAEAQISRKVPDGIEIRISEQRAVAVIDVGRRFLIDEQGVVFKEQANDDPKNLPEVFGLRYADLRLDSGRDKYEPPASDSDLLKSPKKTDRRRLMEAVIAVLKLGEDGASVVPTHEIRRIDVDRQLGITLVAFDPGKPIKLGFDNYAAKYMVLKQIMVMLEQKTVRGINDFSAVDLNDMDRIVVRPLRDVPKAGT